MKYPPWHKEPCHVCGIEFQLTRSTGRDIPDDERILCEACAMWEKGFEDGKKHAEEGVAKKKTHKGWTRENALEFIEEIASTLLAHGWGIGLTGSVLVRGSSRNDLDLIVYPQDSSNRSYGDLVLALTEANMTLKHDTPVVHRAWHKRGSNDKKKVQVWMTKDGRKVDVFILE